MNSQSGLTADTRKAGRIKADPAFVVEGYVDLVLFDPGRRKHLRSLVTVAIGTGMRRGDQLNLLWEKVDFQRDVIYVPNSKRGKITVSP